MKFIKALFATLVLAATSSFAQNSAFTYQGRLDDNGGPATGFYDLQLSIYDSLSGGNLLEGPQTITAVGVTNGLFTVSLDFGADVFDGAQRWIQIGVRTNGGAVFSSLNPRQSVTASPYAIRSAISSTAATVSGSIASAQITGAIPASQLSGTLNDSLLSTNIARLNTAVAFSGATTFTNVENTFIASPTDNRNASFTLTSSNTFAYNNRSFAIADVNADGLTDVVVGHGSSNALSVLINTGSRTLALSSVVPLPTNATSLATADVNGDGSTDVLAIYNALPSAWVLTNDQSGGFAIRATETVGASPEFIATGDMNSDGHMDFVTANRSGASLSVMTNDGTGDFALAATVAVGSQPYCVMVVDVNKDSRLDLVSVDSGDQRLSIVTNNGTGGFVLSARPSVGSLPRFGLAADVNNDTWPDLLSLNYFGDTFSVLTNNGAGAYALSSSPFAGDSPRYAAAADLNGDGSVDLISASIFQGPINLFTNDGNGTFSAVPFPASTNYYDGVAIADIDTDGRLDILGLLNATLLIYTAGNVPGFVGSFAGDGSGLTNLTLLSATTTSKGAVQVGTGLLVNSSGVLSVAYGTNTNNAVQGNQTATIGAGNGLTGGITNDALGNGFSATLSVGSGNGIVASSDSVDLGSFSSDWIQASGGDIVLSNLFSEIKILESSVGGTFFGRIDVGDLTSDATYTFAGSSGTIWTSGNDGQGSGLNADLFDGVESTNVAMLDRNQTYTGTNIFTQTLSLGNYVGGTDGSAVATYKRQMILGGSHNTGFNLGNSVKLLIADYDNESSSDIYPIYVEDENNVVDFYVRNQGGVRSAYFAGEVTAPGFGGNPVFSGMLNASAGIRLHNTSLWLRSSTDENHGLGWYGSTRPFAGASPNGPVLFGYGGGALGTADSGLERIALSWTSTKRVGVGMTNPAAQLHVSGAGGDGNPQGWFNQETASDYSRIRLTVSSNFNHRWDVGSISNRFSIYSGYFGANMLVLDSSGLTVRGTFVSSSDRAVKQNFKPVDPEEVLEKVVSLPITEWSYKADAETRHVGPTAQDFHSAFGVGADDKHIAMVDADGVALAAIQGLNQKLEAELQAKDDKIKALEEALRELQSAVHELRRAP